MKATTKRKIRKIISPFKRIGLKNKNFTIISNNCWGGIVYDILGLKYNSPTIGCFFMADDYISFISNIKKYLDLTLEQVKKNESKHFDYIKDTLPNDIIIGKLGNIEIFFLHYDSFSDAKLKFERRSKRINYDNILIKFSDQNQFKMDNFYSFEKLNYKNKIFITTNQKYKSDSVNIVVVNDDWNVGYAKDDIKPSLKKININKILNNLD